LSNSLVSTAARARTTFQALLPDAGRGTQRRGMRWTTRMITVTMMTEVEISKVGDTAAAAVVEGSAREVFRVRVSS
jgi:hypothetical protein